MNSQALSLISSERTPRDTKRPMSVFQYQWKWLSWRGFWNNIKSFFRGIKYAYQRAVRGYADCDTWDCGSTIIDYLINVLTTFRNKTNCWPDQYFVTFEEWVEYIDSIIDLLEFGSQDVDKASKWYPIWKDISLNPCGPRNKVLEDRIYNLYREEIQSLYKQQEEAIQTAMIRISLYINDIWW